MNLANLAASRKIAEEREAATRWNRSGISEFWLGGILASGDVVTEKPPIPNLSLEEEANHGILDPALPNHFLPEGLERKRRGPLNPRTGRRPERVNQPSETG
ncbi:MAG: hypothetical protein R3D69_13580 [Xanthobacteraceae bacterium]